MRTKQVTLLILAIIVIASPLFFPSNYYYRVGSLILVNGLAVTGMVILIGYGQMDTAEAKALKPHVVFVDADNKIMATGFDPAETFDGPGLVRGDLSAGR